MYKCFSKRREASAADENTKTKVVLNTQLQKKPWKMTGDRSTPIFSSHLQLPLLLQLLHDKTRCIIGSDPVAQHTTHKCIALKHALPVGMSEENTVE